MNRNAAAAVWAAHRPTYCKFWDYSQLKKSGSAKAQHLRDQIVMANRGLVVSQARRAAKLCREPIEDLTQEGMLGLIEAVESFDPSLGNAFSSYAVPKIRSAIMHYLRDKGWGCVRPPRRTVEQYAAVQKAQREAAKRGRALSLEETAEGMGISGEQWAWIVAARSNRPPISLDESPLQLAADEEREAVGTVERAWALQRWSELGEPHRSILGEHYFACRSAAQIAKRRQMSAEVVQVIINQGIEQIRERVG